MSHTETLSRIASRSLRVAVKLGFIASVFLFVVYAAPQMVGAEQSYVVTSGSMEPVLSAGDVVLVYDTPTDNIQEGDIITFFEDEDKTVTHRAIDIVEEGDQIRFKTKGDNNQEADPGSVPSTNIVGVVPTFVLPVIDQAVALHIPMMGHVIGFAGTDYGYLFMVGVPVALLLVNEVWSLARAHRTDTAESNEMEGFEVAESQSEPSPDLATNGEPTAESDEGTYTISATDLTLTLGALLLLAAYSGFMAYRIQSPLSVAVAVAAIGSTGLTAVIRYLAAGNESNTGNAATTTEKWTDASDRALPQVPDEAFGSPRVVLESFEEFTASAEAVESYIVTEMQDGTCLVTVEAEGDGTRRSPPVGEEVTAGGAGAGPAMVEGDGEPGRVETDNTGGQL